MSQFHTICRKKPFTLEITPEEIHIQWRIRKFRERYGPTSKTNQEPWEEQMYPSLEAFDDWFLPDDEHLRFCFQMEWLLINEMVKNIFDHADFGSLHAKWINLNGKKVIDISIASFSRIKNFQHTQSFYNSLSVEPEKFVSSSRQGNGWNYGVGISMIMGQLTHLLQPTHIEKILTQDHIWLRYSGYWSGTGKQLH